MVKYFSSKSKGPWMPKLWWYKQVLINFIAHDYKVFFKVLSSWSFFKGKWLWVLKSNMADKTSYRSCFPATAARFVKKTVPSWMFLNLPWVRSLFMFSEKIGSANLYFYWAQVYTWLTPSLYGLLKQWK